MTAPAYRYESAVIADLDELVDLRIQAMRESLQRLGRFDAARARERFARTFTPACTRFIVTQQGRVGFIVIKPHEDGLLLDHLYLQPAAQGEGLGSAVLREALVDADRRGLAVHVGALRESASNRLYLRYGFLPVGESDWDIYYRRAPRPPAQ